MDPTSHHRHSWRRHRFIDRTALHRHAHRLNRERLGRDPRAAEEQARAFERQAWDELRRLFFADEAPLQAVGMD
jgi:hypothetical protein